MTQQTYSLVNGLPIEHPLASVQFVMDLLTLDKMPVADLYSLPDFLVDEIRLVMSAWNRAQHAKAAT